MASLHEPKWRSEVDSYLQHCGLLWFYSCLIPTLLSELQHTFAMELKDSRAEEKAKVTLECETRRPAKRVKWLKGMLELRSSRKYVIRQKGVMLSLTINSLEKSDTDIYICDVGNMQSRAQLTVQGETGRLTATHHAPPLDGFVLKC